MKFYFSIHKAGTNCLHLFLLTLFAIAAFAQPPGRPPMRPPRSMSALQAPLPILTSALKLTEEQRNGIEALQREFRKRQGRPGPPGEGGPNNFPRDDRGGDFGGPPPPPPEIRDFEGLPPPRPEYNGSPRMQANEGSALKKIKALLSENQRKELPELMRLLNSLQESGVPLPVYLSLNLSSIQKNFIVQIVKSAREQSHKKMLEADLRGEIEARQTLMDKTRKLTHERVLKTLTELQRSIIAKFEKEHPRRERRRGGGPPPWEGDGPPPHQLH